jgi:hypothetical protein
VQVRKSQLTGHSWSGELALRLRSRAGGLSVVCARRGGLVRLLACLLGGPLSSVATKGSK